MHRLLRDEALPLKVDAIREKNAFVIECPSYYSTAVKRKIQSSV